MNGAVAIAGAGMAAATARFEASAARTAMNPLGDLATGTVERIEASSAVRANVAVLRSADEMTGALLDILA